MSHPSEESIEAFLQSLKGKSIAVVGGASSILNSGHGAAIDQSDFIVRMNRSFPKKPADQGKRTDLLTLSCDISKWQHWWHYKSCRIMWMSPKVDQMEPWMRKRSDLLCYPLSYWEQLSSKLEGQRPSTGAMTLDFICHYLQPQQLDLYGFDFKQSKTLFQKKQKLGSHNWDLEREYVLSLIESGQAKEKNWILHQT